MRLTLVSNLSADPVGELRVEPNEIQSVRQNYEASVITLKNGLSYRIQGIYRTLDELLGRNY